MKIEKKKGSKKKIYIYIYGRPKSRTRDRSSRSHHTTRVSVFKEWEKKKNKRNDKASFENILYVCCSHIYIFLDASPRFRLVEHCTFYRFIISTRSTYRWYRASGRGLGETCRSTKRKKKKIPWARNFFRVKRCYSFYGVFDKKLLAF